MRQSATLLLDAGDSLRFDAEPALSSQGATSIVALNRMAYDAVTVGEGDLAVGLDAFKQRQAEAKFPFLSANLVLRASGELLAKPLAILNVQGRLVAVIGLTGAQDVAPDGPFAIRDPLETLRVILPEAAKLADFVIVLSHAGLEVDREIVRSMPEVGLVVRGGVGTLPAPETGAAGGLIVQAEQPTAGHAGRFLGVARLALDVSGRLKGQAWQPLSLGPEVPDDPALADWANGLPR